MRLRAVLILLSFVLLIGCQKKAFEIIGMDEPKKAEGKKMIDVTTVLEEHGGKKIPTFEGGGWAIAVRSLKSGYTYYYDSNNNFLGRKKD